MITKQLSNGIYIVSGPVNFVLNSGKISSIGKPLAIKEHIFIPEGKRIPLEVLENSIIELDKDIELTYLTSRTIPEDWDKVVNYVIENKIDTLLIFGEVDTGKTFFSTYLTNKFINNKLKVSVLDCDTGQSDIGPPGCLGLAVFDNYVLFMTEKQPQKLYFIGSHSPSEHFLHYLCGFVKLVNFAKTNSDVLIIDTPGWVQGDGGRLLRKTEIELLSSLDRNFCVILLQRGDELEHLVKGLKEQQIIRLTVSKKASPTSVDERKKLREFVYKKYFSNSKRIELEFDKIVTDRSYFLTGKKIDKYPTTEILWAEKLSGWEGVYIVSSKVLTETEINRLKKFYNTTKIRNVSAEEFKNVVVALLDINFEVLGLGIIETIDFANQKIVVSTPITSSYKKIKIVQFGSLKVKPTAEENGFVEPGLI